MNFADIDAITTEMAAVVRDAIAAATAPMLAEIDAVKAENVALTRRIEAAEAREFPTFDPSPIEARVKSLSEALEARPKPQEPAPLPDVAGMVQEAVSGAVAAVEAGVKDVAAEAAREAVAALPAPKDYDADVAWLREELRANAEAIAAVPKPEPIPDLSDFATKAEIETLARAIADMPPLPEIPELPDLSGFVTVEDLAALPQPDLSGFALKADIPTIPDPIVPKDFAPEIAALTARVDAIKAPEVIHGKDGAGIAEVKQNSDGEMIVKLTNGETFNAGRVRGADGFGFDDMTAEDGERDFSLVFTKGDRVERFTFAKGVLIDRGVWREGETYQKGDGVTWAGSFWIAQKETDGKPDGGDFRLAVKKGRDGKNGTIPEPRPETVKR